MVIITEREKHRIGIRGEREKTRLYRESITDPLTGIENRNGLRSAFDRMVEDMRNKPYWFAMIDMDRFKSINDTYGHAVGDRYLQQMSEVLKTISAARPFRFGGDEFCLLIYDHDKTEVEQICRAVQEHFLETEVCKTIQPVTISFGVAAYRRGVPPADLVRYADSALYQAKQNRGSICFYKYPVAVAYGA
jgi:diguanylate cyclase